MRQQDDSKNSYADRKLRFLERHNKLLKNVNSEIEQKYWSKELLLFHSNSVISNQIQEIKELKATIEDLKNANSVKIARFIKGRILGLLPQKNNVDINEDRSQ